MTPQEMTEICNKRMMAALNMEKPDRIPILFSGHCYYNFIDPTMVMADFWRRPRLVDENLIKAAKLPILKEIDSPPMVSLGMPAETKHQSFAAKWFAKMKVPGRELPENALWQISEQGPMTEEDYDIIINKGWNYLKQELLKRIGFDPDVLPKPDMDYGKELQVKVAALGKQNIGRAGGMLPFPPFEVLSGARKLPKFFRDLYRIPDKVRAALDIVEDECVEESAKLIDAIPGAYGFIGGTRAGCDFISSKVFEKFYFSYYRKLVPMMHKKM